MHRRYAATLAVAMTAAARVALAQSDGLRIIVRAPAVAPGTLLEISVNRIVRSAELPPSREVTVTFPPIAEGLVTVRIGSQRLGMQSRVWSNEVRLNGSSPHFGLSSARILHVFLASRAPAPASCRPN